MHRITEEMKSNIACKQDDVTSWLETIVDKQNAIHEEHLDIWKNHLLQYRKKERCLNIHIGKLHQ